MLYRRAVAEGDRLLATKQQVPPHRAPLGMLIKLGTEAIGVRQTDPEQAVLIGLRRYGPGEFVEPKRILRFRVAAEVDRSAASLNVSPQLALDFVPVRPRQTPHVFAEWPIQLDGAAASEPQPGERG